jgi:hypothetical protein
VGKNVVKCSGIGAELMYNWSVIFCKYLIIM